MNIHRFTDLVMNRIHGFQAFIAPWNTREMSDHRRRRISSGLRLEKIDTFQPNLALQIVTVLGDEA